MPAPPLSLLVPIDFSDISIRTASTAAELGARMGGALTLLHVRPISDVRAAILEGREDLLRGTSETLAEGMSAHYSGGLAELRTRLGAQRVHLATGAASLEICRLAAHGFDVVVMARRGRGGLSAILGGTTQKVLASSPIPVVVVPPS